MEVVRRFDLVACMLRLTRCMKCSAALERVSRDSVWDRLPARVREKDEFHLCSGCGAVYSEGTHHARMKEILEWVKGNEPDQLDPGLGAFG